MAFNARWKMGSVGAALGLLAGCSGTAPGPTTSEPVTTDPTTVAPVSPEALEAAITEDIEALRALDVVDVGRLVMRLPEEATRCYGYPCTDEDKALWNAEREVQAERLNTLVERAVPAVGDADTSKTPSESEVDASLKSLRALEIVEVGDLLVTTPKNTPECYNLPCPADIKAAEAENAKRRARVVALADAAEK
jgi:hypothetical protein